MAVRLTSLEMKLKKTEKVPIASKNIEEKMEEHSKEAFLVSKEINRKWQYCTEEEKMVRDRKELQEQIKIW